MPARRVERRAGWDAEVGEPLGACTPESTFQFTGSTETGRRFLRYAAESNLKEWCWNGRQEPRQWCWRMPRTSTVVAAHVVNGAFWNMGENCSAAIRG